MSRINRQNIDRQTNKPNPIRTEGLTPDQQLNRAYQTRRDDDVIKSPQRTLYDVDFAIKSYIEETIQPQITDNGQLVSVPVIFANGEKWDNVRRLGYMRDEKGKLQSPLIMLNRKSTVERDNVKGLDVNRMPHSGFRAYKQKYNERNRYEDELFPIPKTQPAQSEKIYLVDIPRYVTIEYDLMLWCDFTTQMNELIDQIMPYSRFSWGVGFNSFPATLSQFSFETVNTIGEDRLVRSTTSISVQAALLSEQEARQSTLQKMFSVKKVTFEIAIDVGVNIFSTTTVPVQLLRMQSIITSGGNIMVSGGGTTSSIDAETMAYLTNLTEKIATYSSTTTVTVAGVAAINPVTLQAASENEFDIYINGQYADKATYTWTPTNMTTQTIVFDTAVLGYPIESTDVIVVKGRWA
jgi:glutaredoxin